MNRIVFDSRYTSALLRQGIDEGLISIFGALDAPVIQKAVALPGIQTDAIIKDALWHIVLHDEAFYNFYGVDNLHFEDSAFHEAVAPIPGQHQNTVWERLKAYGAADASYLHAILKVNGVTGISPEDIHRFVVKSNDGTLAEELMDSLETSLSENYDQYLERYELLNSLDLRLPNTSIEPDNAIIKPTLTESEFNQAQAREPQLDAWRNLQSELGEHLLPLVAANQIEANLKLLIDPGKPESVVERTTSRQATDQALSIWLKEIDRAPDIRSIGEALELRADRRVVDFREVLFDWARQIRIDPAKAAEMENDIRLAHKSLSTIGRARKINGFVGTMILAADIAQFLFSKNVVLLPVAITSYCMEKILSSQKELYSWILFGRS